MKFQVQLRNKISESGLKRFPPELYEVRERIDNPDVMIVRSDDINTMEFPDSLLAIGRAGVGVNNIPVDRCSEKGIVVMNTPGANANAVAELVIGAMLLSARNIFHGIAFTKSLTGKGMEIPDLVEKSKKNFSGSEIRGKKLGLVGLGRVGVVVANNAVALGMTAEGYDPYISVESAWKLSNTVKMAKGIEGLVSTSDYISIHVPLNDATRGMINNEKFRMMKRGIRLFNFSRSEVVNKKDLIEAMREGIVDFYVTDFPEDDLLKMEQVICIPHLGASTKEAEEACSVIAVDELRSFLEHGNINNSVNLPDCYLERRNGANRITVVNRNVPGIVANLSTIFSSAQLNIVEMINKSQGNFAYNIVDIEGAVSEEVIQRIKMVENIIRVRKLSLEML